jgi:hypothetical protein
MKSDDYCSTEHEYLIHHHVENLHDIVERNEALNDLSDIR